VVEPPAFARGLFPACLKMKMKMEGMQACSKLIGSQPAIAVLLLPSSPPINKTN